MKTYNLSSDKSVVQNSSGGKLLKWKVGNHYIKTSTIDNSSLQTRFMWESYGEVIASKLALRLGYNSVRYRLCKVIIDNSIETIACESIDFKQNGYTDLSIGKLMISGKIPIIEYGTNGYYKLLHYMSNVPKFKEYIDSLILLDSLILNEDRHYGNFGILVSSKSKNEILTQPIFDNGNGLFCHKHIEELEYTPDLMQYLRCKPFDIDFDRQLSLIKIPNEIKHKLIELKGYIINILKYMVGQGLDKHRTRFIRDLLYSRIDIITK